MTAQDLSNRAIAFLGSMGVTLSPSIARNMPAVAQALLVISAPLRSSIRTYLTAQLTQLRIAKAALLISLQQFDYAAKLIGALSTVVTNAMAPIDHFMTQFPLDSALSKSPDVVRILKQLGMSVPAKIPPAVAVTLQQIGVADFFDGVSDYQGLRKKMNDLLVRSKQNVSLSHLAETKAYLLDQSIAQVQAYINIIDTLEVPSTSFSYAPVTFDFGTVTVGSSSYKTIALTNDTIGQGGVGGTFSLSGDASFTLRVASTSWYLAEVGATIGIVVAYTPASASKFTDAASVVITHDATSMISPVTVSLTGRGQ
jgi:hypothetical protein